MKERNRLLTVTLLGLAAAIAGVSLPHEAQAGRVIVVERPSHHQPGAYPPGFRGPGRWHGPGPYAHYGPPPGMPGAPPPWSPRPHVHPFPIWGVTAITLKLLDNANEEQQRLHEAALARASEAEVGDTIVWEEGDASGAVTTTRRGRTRSGLPCREFQQEITIGGASKRAYGTACQQADGSWRIVSDK